MWWDLWLLLYYNFTAEFVFKEFLKLANIWRSYGNKVDSLPQAPCAPGQCPTERWRTRLRSDVWIMAGRNSCTNSITLRQYASLTLNPWSNWCAVNHCDSSTDAISNWTLSSVHTTRIHGPCSRAVDTAVNTVSKMTPVFTDRIGHSCI